MFVQCLSVIDTYYSDFFRRFSHIKLTYLSVKTGSLTVLCRDRYYAIFAHSERLRVESPDIVYSKALKMLCALYRNLKLELINCTKEFLESPDLDKVLERTSIVELALDQNTSSTVNSLCTKYPNLRCNLRLNPGSDMDALVLNENALEALGFLEVREPLTLDIVSWLRNLCENSKVRLRLSSAGNVHLIDKFSPILDRTDDLYVTRPT